jgi:hypothetical protein
VALGQPAFRHNAFCRVLRNRSNTPVYFRPEQQPRVMLPTSISVGNKDTEKHVHLHQLLGFRSGVVEVSLLMCKALRCWMVGGLNFKVEMWKWTLVSDVSE